MNIEEAITMHHRLTDNLDSAAFTEYREISLKALEQMRERDKEPENDPFVLIEALRQTDEYIPLIFTQGGCWKFHKFLKLIFSEAVPYKVISEPTIRINRYDHIITRIGERYFDISGEVKPTDFIACSIVEDDDIPTFERWSFAGNHLLARACPYCGEDIAMDSAGNIDKADDISLTLEELREMDGEPVWIEAWPDWGHWELSEDAEDYLADRDEDFYGMTMPPGIPDPAGRYGLHALGWLAYSHKPGRRNSYGNDQNKP